MEVIKLHIAADNPVTATKVIQSVLSASEGLIDFPMLGHTGQRTGTRELALSKYPYTIIYRLASKKIHIVAVVHQSRQHPS
ncbi:MAG: type II toxin-antitoxin system RelE/ParE family toxin [Nitrosomonadales bacterium]|nr:type II toxin-antitoxin system RelE/ParE family toxin [Nitrosomonadales bacterium]